MHFIYKTKENNLKNNNKITDTTLFNPPPLLLKRLQNYSQPRLLFHPDQSELVSTSSSKINSATEL